MGRRWSKTEGPIRPPIVLEGCQKTTLQIKLEESLDHPTPGHPAPAPRACPVSRSPNPVALKRPAAQSGPGHPIRSVRSSDPVALKSDRPARFILKTGRPTPAPPACPVSPRSPNPVHSQDRPPDFCAAPAARQTGAVVLTPRGLSLSPWGSFGGSGEGGVGTHAVGVDV